MMGNEIVISVMSFLDSCTAHTLNKTHYVVMNAVKVIHFLFVHPLAAIVNHSIFICTAALSRLIQINEWLTKQADNRTKVNGENEIKTVKLMHNQQQKIDESKTKIDIKQNMKMKNKDKQCHKIF